MSKGVKWLLCEKRLDDAAKLQRKEGDREHDTSLRNPQWETEECQGGSSSAVSQCELRRHQAKRSRRLPRERDARTPPRTARAGMVPQAGPRSLKGSFQGLVGFVFVCFFFFF